MDISSVLSLYAEMVMKLCSTVNQRSNKNSLESIQNCADDILQSAFQKATTSNRLAEFENTLLVYMGLMKVKDHLDYTKYNPEFIIYSFIFGFRLG